MEMYQTDNTKSSGNAYRPDSSQEIKGRANARGSSINRHRGEKIIPVPPPDTGRPAHLTQTARVVDPAPRRRPQPSVGQTGGEVKTVTQPQQYRALSPDQTLQQQVFTLAKQGNWGSVAEKVGFLELNQLKNEDDEHLIHIAAAQSGSLATLTHLASIEGLINITDKNGYTAVMIALRKSRGINTIKILLSADPDPAIKEPDTGKNLLHLLLEIRLFDAFDRLSKKHPSLIWQRDTGNNSPVTTAVRMGHISWKEAEKRFGDDDASNDMTPAHIAAGASSLQPGQPEPIAARREQSPATAQQDLEAGKQADEAFWKGVKNAARAGDKEKIRSLYANRAENRFNKKYGNYHHVAFIAIMDDRERLEYAMYLYPQNYKADLHLWHEQNPLKDDHLIKTAKKLTRDSKLIIDGHGPYMARMSGGEFAFRLNVLLNEHCSDNQTPRITLTGCRPADASKHMSFAEQLSKTLALLGREAEITAATEKIFITSSGKVLCAKAEKDKNGSYTVEYWQGEDEWLNLDTQQHWNFCNITTKNRRTTLIKVITTKPSATTTVTQDKYEIQGAPGLQSLIPGIVQK